VASESPVAAFAVAAVAPDTVALSGALTFATAEQALDQARAALAQHRPAVLELGGVTRADSAGLACVLALVADASRAGKALQVANMPAGMRALARVCDVQAMLGG
jgi:phospholipid transport system transporter-binding protein